MVFAVAFYKPGQMDVSDWSTTESEQKGKKAATTAFHVGDSSANLSNQILGQVCFQGFSLSKRIGIKLNSDVSHLKIHF